MPKLIKEQKAAGNKKTPFDLEKIRKLGRDNGFATQAWDDKDLESEADSLVKKKLIEDLGGGKYQISDLGIEWKVETT